MGNMVPIQDGGGKEEPLLGLQEGQSRQRRRRRRRDVDGRQAQRGEQQSQQHIPSCSSNNNGIPTSTFQRPVLQSSCLPRPKANNQRARRPGNAVTRTPQIPSSITIPSMVRRMDDPVFGVAGGEAPFRRLPDASFAADGSPPSQFADPLPSTDGALPRQSSRWLTLEERSNGMECPPPPLKAPPPLADGRVARPSPELHAGQKVAPSSPSRLPFRPRSQNHTIGSPQRRTTYKTGGGPSIDRPTTNGAAPKAMVKPNENAIGESNENPIGSPASPLAHRAHPGIVDLVSTETVAGEDDDDHSSAHSVPQHMVARSVQENAPLGLGVLSRSKQNSNLQKIDMTTGSSQAFALRPDNIAQWRSAFLQNAAVVESFTGDFCFGEDGSMFAAFLESFDSCQSLKEMSFGYNRLASDITLLPAKPLNPSAALVRFMERHGQLETFRCCNASNRNSTDRDDIVATVGLVTAIQSHSCLKSLVINALAANDALLDLMVHGIACSSRMDLFDLGRMRFEKKVELDYLDDDDDDTAPEIWNELILEGDLGWSDSKDFTLDMRNGDNFSRTMLHRVLQSVAQSREIRCFRMPEHLPPEKICSVVKQAVITPGFCLEALMLRTCIAGTETFDTLCSALSSVKQLRYLDLSFRQSFRLEKLLPTPAHITSLSLSVPGSDKDWRSIAALLVQRRAVKSLYLNESHDVSIADDDYPSVHTLQMIGRTIGSLGSLSELDFTFSVHQKEIVEFFLPEICKISSLESLTCMAIRGGAYLNDEAVPRVLEERVAKILRVNTSLQDFYLTGVDDHPAIEEVLIRNKRLAHASKLIAKASKSVTDWTRPYDTFQRRPEIPLVPLGLWPQALAKLNTADPIYRVVRSQVIGIQVAKSRKRGRGSLD